MTLDETIRHERILANLSYTKDFPESECYEEHRQLVEWLTELRELRELIGEDGKTYVFIVLETDGKEEWLMDVFGTNDGATDAMEQSGYTYKTAGAGDFDAIGWYKRTRNYDGSYKWLRARIFKWEVRP